MSKKNKKNKEKIENIEKEDIQNKVESDQKSENIEENEEIMSEKEEEIKEELVEEISELEEIQAKYDEINDKYIRLSAEFDNYRRRTLKEKMELIKSAGSEILVNILPVMDNFERGLSSIEETKDIESLKEGINLIYKNFKEFLTQKGVTEMGALEQDFDTDKHEAIAKIKAPNKKLKGKIVDVIEKGYKLNDKVIRYAKVVIGE